VARLNRFIEVMQQQSGTGLSVAEGKPICLMRGNTAHPMTREALTAGQVTALLKEIAPQELRGRMASDAALQFAYQAPAGEVQVTLRTDDGRTTALLTPAAAAPATQDAPAAAPVPRAAVRDSEARRPSAARTELDRLLTMLVETGGSDLHLRVGEPPVIRRDGKLARTDEAPLTADDLQQMLESIMLPKDVTQHAETGDADYAYEIEGVARFRCNAARDRRGPMGVFRVIPSAIPTCDQLGISREVQKLCYLTKGLVVVTGPTGSGKSTTLAALVDLMNREREEHILTIEDPVEFVHESKRCLVTHRQVGLHTQSFKSGLRAALREDPDIVLIGELRDLETVAIAIETAETGHLVFGTLHTTTAVSTVDRIIDQFPGDRQPQIRVMLSESLRGVIAQTLCQKVGGGRVAAREILLSIPAVSNLVREGKTYQIPSIMQTNRKVGMVTLNDSLLDLVERKLVEPKEAYMKSVDKASLENAMKAKGYALPFLKAAAT